MLKKRKLVVAVMLCLAMVLLVPLQTVQAKTTSEKSMTITLSEENPICTCSFLLNKEAKLKVQVKVLSVSGKAKDKKIYFGAYDAYGSEGSKGSLFYNLKTSKIKKNKTFTSKELSYGLIDSGDVFFDLPEGLKKLKIKVTFTSSDGEKVIKSLKETEY